MTVKVRRDESRGQAPPPARDDGPARRGATSSPERAGSTPRMQEGRTVCALCRWSREGVRGEAHLGFVRHAQQRHKVLSPEGVAGAPR
jgi:hypothetical protein